MGSNGGGGIRSNSSNGGGGNRSNVSRDGQGSGSIDDSKGPGGVQRQSQLPTRKIVKAAVTEEMGPPQAKMMCSCGGRENRPNDVDRGDRRNGTTADNRGSGGTQRQPQLLARIQAMLDVASTSIDAAQEALLRIMHDEEEIEWVTTMNDMTLPARAEVKPERTDENLDPTDAGANTINDTSQAGVPTSRAATGAELVAATDAELVAVTGTEEMGVDNDR